MKFVRSLLKFLLFTVVIVAYNYNFVWSKSSFRKVELPSSLESKMGPVHTLAFSPDGSLLASAGADRSITVWSTSKWRVVRRIEANSGTVHTLTFNPDGSVLATGAGDGTVQLWNTAIWSNPKVIPAHDREVRVVAFSKNGKFLVTAGRDNKPKPKSRFGKAKNLFSSDKTDDVAKVWSTSKWSLYRKLPQRTSRVVALSFNPSGQLLVSGEENGEIAIVNTETWQTIKRLKIQHGSLETLTFDVSGTRLIGIGYRQGLTRKYWQSLTIWATSDWALVTASENQTSPPQATGYSPREGWLAIGSRDGALTLRMSKDGAKVLETFQKLEFDTPINVMQFSPDGRTLVFGNADGTIKVLEHLLPIPTPGHSVVSLEPVPMPKPMPLVVPEISIPVPSITADFDNPASVPGVIVFLVVVGAIAFIWFRVRHTTSPSQEVNEPLPKNQEYRPLSKNRGYVYLLKAGPYYKIGRSKDFNKRIKAIKLQLPFDTEQVHVVETSDMIKLENKWHRRFKEKRENGEWFLLSDADVWEFKQQ